MAAIEKRVFDEPDATSDAIERMLREDVGIGGAQFTRVTVQPGWRWSEHVRPIVQTESCQVDHLVYMLSGRMAARADSGDEVEFAAGEWGHIPPGHDGWTVGEEPAVWIEVVH
ncbi:cupin domain-containing protein [Agromyces seonyuensis]|uniref:Cupin n=1 Tax=Agromyces seonyuensis TaxID=2662446 RepID=A0A6I4NUI3_9MICO|nr:cupin domain-containing protein [Agromyces seonyuensis]MWB97751.1 cupin [Agromyces seonyuensis]